ncbi:hypothetical protein F2P81_019285 [Scophthalmus maximus]|uniref:Sperm-associated antigen 6 n=1 Tax=Scophthalmus maximus TaxID=52904 RepID=A0A6A4S7J1_SCOMX|nr:hypothetical protein F2P81_019285 [Scophthalmus maximus]
MQFVQTVADLANRPQNIEFLQNAGVMSLLRPLMLDVVPGIQQTAALALSRLADHSYDLAEAVVNEDILPQLVHSLASQNSVVDAGAIPLLVLCLREPEMALKRIAASTLSDISKHTAELAQAVVDTGAIAHLAQMILNPDAKLKRQVFSALSQISKHSVGLAEMVIEAEIFPAALACLKDPDEYVRKNVTTLMREVVKQTPEGVLQLAQCLSEETEHHIKAATVWAIGQIGHHTPEHAKAVATANLLPKLLELYTEAGSSEDLQVKSKEALKSILQKCTYLPGLESLLYDAPSNILKHVVCQFSKVLPHDSKARRLFVTSGGLKKVQEIDAGPGSPLQEYINAINSCFPEEIVSSEEGLLMRLCFAAFEQYKKSRMEFVQTVAQLAAKPQNIEFLQNAGVMSLLRPLMLDVVPGIQQTAALALSRLADHSYDLAEAVVNEDILPQLVNSLASQNRFYKKAAASVLRAVAKHSPGLSQAVVECGGVDALVLCLEEFDPGVKEAAAWTLGIIAQHNAMLSQSVVDAGAIPLLVLCLREPEMALKRNAASTLSDISKHTAELAQAVVDTGAIAHLAQMILNPDAKLKSKEALKSILQKCTYLPGLESLLYDAPSNILKHVVCQFSKVLPHDSKARRLFVTSGGLKKVQEIDAEPGSPLQEYINAINSCFPEEIVRYYSPGYSEVLLERLESFQPA